MGTCGCLVNENNNKIDEHLNELKILNKDNQKIKSKIKPDIGKKENENKKEENENEENENEKEGNENEKEGNEKKENDDNENNEKKKYEKRNEKKYRLKEEIKDQLKECFRKFGLKRRMFSPSANCRDICEDKKKKGEKCNCPRY